ANNQLSNIVNPGSVTSIGESAFEYNQLTNINIPNGVTYIGSSAFFRNELTNFNIPNGVPYIGAMAFFDNLLTSVVIPNSVTTIGNDAFRGNKLTSVIIPKSVISLGDAAFTKNLITEVNGKPSNGIIYGRLSDGTDNLHHISSYGGTRKIINFIPTGVTSLGNYSFCDQQLESVDIPNSVISIGDGAFSNNQRTLKSIKLPIHPTFSSYGWTDEYDHSYKAGDEVSDYYTTYEIKGAYTISYLLDEGTNDSRNPNVYHIDTGVNSFQDPSKEGFVFKGWYSGRYMIKEILPSEWGFNYILQAKWQAISTDINHTTRNSLKVFPNPASEMISIESDDQTITQLSVLNSSGSLVLQKAVNGKSDRLSISHLPAGIYFMNITLASGQSHAQKILIK
ncbi:MAG: leucine-rich repeat protein, partial [Carboxylicivirga sp.]|nr:leucine-rich repeat protein [Carboxylicivirga sp.]